MLTLRATGVALAGGLWMSGLCLADETSVRAHLASDAATTYLQQNQSRLELLEPGNRAPSDAVVFQKFIGDLPLYGARVFVIENPDGTVAQVFDDSTAALELRPGPVNVGQAAAVGAAEALLPNAIESAAKLVWFRTGDEAVLAWQINTSLADRGLPASPTSFEMVIAAENGEMLSQRQIDTKTYAPGSPETADGVFPRIVINNTIGALGSRAYAAPFDAVCAASVGCTGTLIDANTILSARHCGIGPGDFFVFGENSGSGIFAATVLSTSLPDGNGSLLDGGDVSIHTLTAPVPVSVAEPMRLIDETTELVGKQIATIGYGFNGLGSSGHGFTSDGFRWGGENIIDVYGSPADSFGANIISTDFDNGTVGANTIPSSSSTPVQFEATTAPGDSGGPVLVQSGSEWVIAGVLSGGTTSTSVFGDISWWTGTALFRDAIESAGGTFAEDLEILFPNGRPDFVSSDGGDTLDISIVPSAADPVVPGSGTLHLDTGAGFQQIALAANSATSFTATFPATTNCPEDVQYFISFDLQSGATATAPADALTSSNSFSTVAVGAVDFEVLYDFETPVGFSAGAPGDNASTGVWVRGVPIGTEAQPGSDNTPDGTIAWFTGQGSPGGGVGFADVDNGTTSLVSNLIDLSAAEFARISYARWYSNNAGNNPGADVFEVFVSDDNGATYQLVESVGPTGAGTTGGWVETGFTVSDFVSLTSTVRIKFVASDLGAASIVEAAIDDVRILGASCTVDLCAGNAADLIEPFGVLDLSDVQTFLIGFNAMDPVADIAGTDGPDGMFDLLDVQTFLLDFAAGCP